MRLRLGALLFLGWGEAPRVPGRKQQGLRPKCYTIDGIWAPQLYYSGPWTLRESFQRYSLEVGGFGQEDLPW